MSSCVSTDVPDDIYAGDIHDTPPTATSGSGTSGSDPSSTGAGVGGTTSAGTSGAFSTNAGTPGAGAPTTGTTAAPGDTTGLTADAGEDVTEPGVPNPACDFSGRWLVTERRVATGLGVQQAGLYWLYLDIAQSGDQLSVTEGLICGNEVVPIGLLSASVKMDGCWPSLMADNPLDGLSGTASDQGGSCSLSFERYYAVFGATASHYRDPSVPLPTVEQRAEGGTPGWEDCDGDGKPGSTLEVGGILTGQRMCSIRLWGEWNGAVSRSGDTFTVPMNWGEDEVVLEVSSEALKATGVKDGNLSLHFAQFARLGDDQATASDDATRCEQIRALAPQLTPDANQ